MSRDVPRATITVAALRADFASKRRRYLVPLSLARYTWPFFNSWNRPVTLDSLQIAVVDAFSAPPNMYSVESYPNSLLGGGDIKINFMTYGSTQSIAESRSGTRGGNVAAGGIALLYYLRSGLRRD